MMTEPLRSADEAKLRLQKWVLNENSLWNTKIGYIN